MTMGFSATRCPRNRPAPSYLRLVFRHAGFHVILFGIAATCTLSGSVEFVPWHLPERMWIPTSLRHGTRDAYPLHLQEESHFGNEEKDIQSATDNYLQHPSKPMNPSLNPSFSQLPPIQKGRRPLDLGLLQRRHRLVVILVHLVVGLEVHVAHVLLLDREG